jgi:hypothetical protein
MTGIGNLFVIENNGSPLTKWNLVILGDGFSNAELPQFRTHATAFKDVLKTTKPFNAMWKAINVYGVDVSSPAARGPNMQRTFFNAVLGDTFEGKRLDRLFTIDAVHAKVIAWAELPQVTQVLVIINSVKFGGSGVSQVAVTSTDPRAYNVALHEIGHSAFGLADEYDDFDENRPAPTVEPVQPNITIDIGQATLKWRGRKTRDVPIPSSNNGCPGSVAAAGVPAKDAVGAFEGAGHARCGVYRPAEKCRMREYEDPFCPVCSWVIGETLKRHL